MKKTSFISFVFILSLLFIHLAWAGLAPEKVARLKRLADRGNFLSSRIPANKQLILSTGSRRLIQLGKNWDHIEMMLKRAPAKAESGMPDAIGVLKPQEVSDPNAPNELVSRFLGFTQSETSVAQCGSTAVTGFNDTGSVFEQLLVSPSQSFSFVGRARSTNKGKNWTDLEFLNSDPIPAVVPVGGFYDLNGDPVIGCSDENTFYYSSLALQSDGDGIPITSDISISKSTDGGITFGGPVQAASKDALDHQLDKDWMAVDPTNPNIVYVTYTDFDISGTSTGCGAEDRIAIEIVKSTNGGINFGAPVIVAEVCGLGTIQGSNVVVDRAGRVFVAWEDFGEGFPFSARQIFIRTSTDGGANFSLPVKITDVVALGDAFLLQGAFRSISDIPGTGLAVDRSGGSNDGRLYACYQDGSLFSETDGFIGFEYQFGDIFCRSSDDQAVTWSAAVRVNNDTAGLQNIDQFQASVAVDKKGNVGVTFYDRRADPRNFLIGFTLAISKDGGASFSKNKPILKNGFPPIIANDFFLDPAYMGDYSQVTSDFLLSDGGFILTFADNFLGDANVDADTK
jgi:hypothetical protein